MVIKEENIEMLSDEIGLTLTEINKEVFVGSYRCDLVAIDETTGIKVIIENQLEATTDHWYDVALGTSEAHISITLVNKTNSIGIEIYINDNKELFDRLYSVSEEIQNDLGFSMDWQRLDNKKASRIIYYIGGLDFDNHENYDDLINGTIDKVVIIKKSFKKYI